MTLVEFITDLFADNKVELFADEVCIPDVKNGSTIRRNTKILRAISLGAITSNTPEEWYRICRLHSPVGSILTEFDADIAFWQSKYDDILALCRLELTKAMLNERILRSAKVLMDILERRDAAHWTENKQVTADIKTDATVNIVFQDA